MVNLSQISKTSTERGVCLFAEITDPNVEPCDRDSVWRFDQRPGRLDSASFHAWCAIIDGCIPIRVRKSVAVSLSCQRWLPRLPLRAAAWSVCKTNS